VGLVAHRRPYRHLAGGGEGEDEGVKYIIVCHLTVALYNAIIFPTKWRGGKVMKAIAARVSARYQVVIPKPVRETLRLRPNDTLLFMLDGENVILRSQPTSFTTAMQGLHRELWPDPDAWLEEERSTWE
jgi:AbrB family looped-hinge helix DNA binding protein